MCLELGDAGSTVVAMDGGEMAVGRVDDELIVIVGGEAGDCFRELSTINGLMGCWVRRVNVGGWRGALVELAVAASANECMGAANGSHVQSRHKR